MRSAFLSTAVAAMCVGVLWLRFNAPPPDYGSFLPHDLLYSYYPKLDLVSQRLAAGELPLWNPEGCAGVPLLAGIQYAVLYPPTWIAAFVPADRAIGLLVLFHLLLARRCCSCAGGRRLSWRARWAESSCLRAASVRRSGRPRSQPSPGCRGCCCVSRA